MSNLTVKELAAQERKEYFRAWRAANKEKTAEHRRRYWEKKALERLNVANNGEVKHNVGERNNK
jgi:hypothetical protein